MFGTIPRALYTDIANPHKRPEKGRCDTDEESGQWQHQNFYIEGASEVAKWKGVEGNKWGLGSNPSYGVVSGQLARLYCKTVSEEVRTLRAEHFT